MDLSAEHKERHEDRYEAVEMCFLRAVLWYPSIGQRLTEDMREELQTVDMDSGMEDCQIK
jgi:hypothetical protein